MSETKDDIAADRERLAAENTALRAQLAALGRTAVAAPQYTFQLSEGERQELEQVGWINVRGRVMTKADVLAAMAKAGAGQESVEIADAPEGTRLAPPVEAVTGPGVRGIDYVYPSVARGLVDPAVAGTPGINGPAAE